MSQHSTCMTRFAFRADKDIKLSEYEHISTARAEEWLEYPEGHYTKLPTKSEVFIKTGDKYQLWVEEKPQ